DYAQCAVAFLDQGPITRAELGEYLIPRCGLEKLDLLIKKRVLEGACAARGITVTAAEVEGALAEQIRGLNVNRDRFVKEVLRGYHKNLTEWREDVIRPRLLPTRLIRDRLRLSEDDLRQAFEAHYGEKVECRVIFFKDEQEAFSCYGELRRSDDAFVERARKQCEGKEEYAATGGKIKPFGRGTLANKALEEEAFR